LSNSRNISFGGIGYIPMSEILAYVNLVNLTDVEKEYLLPSIVQMDIIYVEKMHEKTNNKNKGDVNGS
jgi:hypothetical protein